MKKIITKILNVYYRDILDEKILDVISSTFDLDIKILEIKDLTFIKAKPIKYKNYTILYCYKENDSLCKLIDINNVIKEIKETIEKIDKNNMWK